MITPIAIFVAGYMIATSDQAKQEQNRKFDILIRVGPSLFESEPGKKILALTIIDEAGLQRELVVPVLMIAGDALKDTRVAKRARDILAKYLSPEQLLEIASSDTDPGISAAASEVVAQNSLIEEIQEIAAKSGNQAVRNEAKALLDKSPYVVYIASVNSQNDADTSSRTANATFRAKHIELTAEVIPPEENCTPYWGISVGKHLAIAEAQSRHRKARQAGYRALLARLCSS
jgi:hypothetical protein